MDALRRYHQDTRDLWNSVLLVLPLFVLYQVGLLATGGIRNGVDLVTNTLLRLSGGGALAYVGLNLLLGAVVFGGALAFSREGRRPFRRELYGWVILESFVYASLLGGVILTVMSYVPGLHPALATMGPAASATPVAQAGIITKIVMSVGAGVHEELVFRLLLFGGMTGAAVRWLKWSEARALAVALLVSSLLFSGVHYIGDLADTFTLFSFSYRFLAGILFAGLFMLRSFAVAVWTHALYDVLVLVF